MFKIYVDDVLMYDDVSTLESLKLVDPKLTISESSAGTFTATVPPGNAGYDHLERTKSLIKIFKGTDTDPYWEGRILDEVIDFWKCKKITCEGILSYLNDTIQPPNYYSSTSAREFLDALLEIHNSKVSADRQFLLGDTGNITLNSSHRYTNYETTLQCINEKLIENNGGYIRIRYEDGKRYLDYLKEYSSENSQKIEFGTNLLDFTKSFNSENYCTVLVPRGAQLEEGPYEALTAYTDVSSVNDGSIYVTLTADDYTTPPSVLPVDSFGWIESVHDWDDVTEPSNLLRKAKNYLKDQQFDTMKLEVSALDMHYAGGVYDEIKLYDSVRVLSAPHGMDRLFPVTKLEIPLDKPEETIFTMGTNEKVSLTHRNRQESNAIKKQISELPTEQKLTSKLKNEAAQMIESVTTGYINIIQNEETGAEELVISSTPDYLTAPNIWRFNLNGLAFSSKGYNSGDYDIALTADGKINASLISVGTLIGDIIKAGVIKDQIDGSHFYFNLETGEFHLSALDGMVIGGRNILRGTRESIVAEEKTWGTGGFRKIYPSSVYGEDISTEIIADSPVHGINAAIKFTSTNVPEIGIFQTEYKSVGHVGEKVTYSCWVKGHAGDTVRVRPFYVSGTVPSGEQQETWVSSYSILENDNWTHLSWTSDPIKSDHVNVNIGGIYVKPKDANASVYVVGLKLEFGTVPTDWTPAPEDIDSEIEDTNTRITDGDNNTYDLLATLLSTEINNTAERFELINTRIDTFENGLEERIATEVESKAGELSIRIEEQRETLEGIEDNLTYFGFKNTGLEIRGTKGSSAGSYLNLASDELALYSNNTKHLWLNQNGANAAYFNAEQGVSVGSFIWEVYSGGIRLRKR